MQNDISNYSNDSRLTEPNNGQRYNLRKMIKKSEKLNRPLNNSEAENFRMNNKQSAEQNLKNKRFKALDKIISNEYYVAGRLFDTDSGEQEFALIKCSGDMPPYITHNPDSPAMKMCGNTNALYAIAKNGTQLRKVHDIHYELDSDSQPETIEITGDLAKQLLRAIISEESLLL